MYWLSKPFSIRQLRECLAFTGLEVTTDQYERLVVYVIDNSSISDASEMLNTVLKQFHIDARPIPCDECSKLYVQNKLAAIPC